MYAQTYGLHTCISNHVDEVVPGAFVPFFRSSAAWRHALSSTREARGGDAEGEIIVVCLLNSMKIIVFCLLNSIKDYECVCVRACVCVCVRVYVLV